MTTAHFKNLPALICKQLSQARHKLQIAVCWFTHHDIYTALLACATRGVRVELLIEYDSQNIRPEGLDFNALIQAGAALYAGRSAALMHHKFALIDGCMLLTGSFNWTYNTNAENLLICKDPALHRAFQSEFESLKTQAQRIFMVRPQDTKVFVSFPLFENTLFQLPELRRRIGQGARAWHINLHALYQRPEAVLQQHLLPFDAAGLLNNYWVQQRIWHRAAAKIYVSELSTPCHTPALLRTLRCWTLRMRMGDLLFAGVQGRQVAAIGILQSEPEPYEGPRFSSARAVQWLKVLQPPLLLEKKHTAAPVCAFRGSALAVLAKVE